MQTLRDDLLLGGRYRIGALLGRGGMAEVYEGFDERLHRDVAVKVLRPEVAADAEVRRRFEDEARSAARLHHPNVVTVFDTGEDGGIPFLVMERLPGETLADRLRAANGGGVDTDWLLRAAGDVLGALGAAHDAGIVHRDVKPGNILIGADGCAKVADFGIAKTLDVRAAIDLTNTNQLLGTPAYLPPERLEGAPASPATDLYALGVVLYEALAGAKPFEGKTPVAVADAVRHRRPPPLAERRPDLPASVTRAIDRAMAADPQQRFARATEMAAALGVAPPVEDDPTIAAAPVVRDADPTVVLPAATAPPVERVRDAAVEVLADPRRARVVAIAAAAAATIVLLAIGLAFAASRGGGDAPARPRAGSAVADGLRAVASGLTAKDGPAAPQAAAQLRALAPLVEDGKGAAEATALLGQLASWRDQGQLAPAAADRAAAVVASVPGVDAGAYTPPTTAPPPTAAPAAVSKKHKGGKHGDD